MLMFNHRLNLEGRQLFFWSWIIDTSTLHLLHATEGEENAQDFS